MLNIWAFKNVLYAVLNPPQLHTAVLFTGTGDLIAHASSHASHSKDRARVLIGIASEVWMAVKYEDVGMVESELGRIVIMPIYPKSSSTTIGSRPLPRINSSTTGGSSQFNLKNSLDPPLLILINASDDVEWAEMLVKSRGVVNHLAGPLAAFGDALSRIPSLPVSRIHGRFY